MRGYIRAKAVALSVRSAWAGRFFGLPGCLGITVAAAFTNVRRLATAMMLFAIVRQMPTAQPSRRLDQQQTHHQVGHDRSH